MTIETARSFFLWCSIINYGLLLLWSLLTIFWRSGLYRLWRLFLPLSSEQFDIINVGGMSLYKIGIILFNIVPCIALYLVR